MIEASEPRCSPVPRRLVACLALSFGLIGTASAADFEGQSSAAYTECLALARKSPEDALESAGRWQAHGGGLPAEHCAALALIGLDQYGEAARKLEDLSNRMGREGPEMRAEALGQAAEAWIDDRAPEEAIRVLGLALKLMPDEPDYLVSRAVARAQLADYRKAVEDLDRAIAVGGPRADALAYRASAWRYIGDRQQARADADKAVQLDPRFAPAWLERGNIKRIGGDVNGARQDWLEVLRLSPDGEAADDARANIEKLDVKVNAALPLPKPAEAEPPKMPESPVDR
jgi:tetratricopeptide (TPR) repeat protein